MPALWLSALIAITTVALPQTACAQRALVEPEAATGIAEKALVTTRRHMVAAANPYAVDAGVEMLRAGGSATDAAIATQLVLGLVEPQSSGLGGGGFTLHFDARSGAVTTLDGRETAPLSARADRFMHNGQPIPFRDAVASGASVGTPGLVALLAEMHRRHGKLPWGRLFEPAIRLSLDGFTVTERLNRLLAWVGPERMSPVARAYFFGGDGRPVAVGSTLRNIDYATTLRAIADRGAQAIYHGELQQAIVRAVGEDPRGPGDLSGDDFAAYEVVERKPLCERYRMWRVCGMGAPSSGGLIVAQVLKLIEPLTSPEWLATEPLTALPLGSMHLLAEAQKLAYADRDRYVADPAFVTVPDGLLDETYLSARRRLIAHDRAMAAPAAGVPRPPRESVGTDATIERGGTTHISVVDDDGNAISMTTSIEGAFGSGLMVGGFLLNNELTDFSFLPTDASGRPIANRIEPGKRPRSSMAPTIVLDETGTSLVAVLGSPGGSKIPFYVIKTLVALLDRGADAKSAAAMANFGGRGDTLEIEAGSTALAFAPALQKKGHQILLGDLNSGVHVIVRKNGQLEGSADPRREGTAAGD